jgi:hypothetical protein
MCEGCHKEVAALVCETCTEKKIDRAVECVNKNVAENCADCGTDFPVPRCEMCFAEKVVAIVRDTIADEWDFDGIVRQGIEDYMKSPIE